MGYYVMEVYLLCLMGFRTLNMTNLHGDHHAGHYGERNGDHHESLLSFCCLDPYLT